MIRPREYAVEIEQTDNGPQLVKNEDTGEHSDFMMQKNALLEMAMRDVIFYRATMTRTFLVCN